MSFLDSLPIISQLKSELVEGSYLDAPEAAENTRENFKNRCVGVSQARSLYELMWKGDGEKAGDIQRDFLEATPGLQIPYHVAQGRPGEAIGDVADLAKSLAIGTAGGRIKEATDLRTKILCWTKDAEVLILTSPGKGLTPSAMYQRYQMVKQGSQVKAALKCKGAAQVTFWNDDDGSCPREVIRNFVQEHSDKKIVIIFNGHGHRDGSWFFPGRVRISAAELRRLFDGVKLANIGIIADCCYSGHVAEEFGEDVAFAVAPGQSNEPTNGVFTHWMFCDAATYPTTALFSQIEIRGQLGTLKAFDGK